MNWAADNSGCGNQVFHQTDGEIKDMVIEKFATLCLRKIVDNQNLSRLDVLDNTVTR